MRACLSLQAQVTCRGSALHFYPINSLGVPTSPPQLGPDKEERSLRRCSSSRDLALSGQSSSERMAQPQALCQQRQRWELGYSQKV